ncbi:LytR family transcriptional regulator [Baekduia soli]|uniref:LytR family transcriptional regulator n=1 Tax=Baekduia soli TaxID=496014 RepID=A0A5B8U3M0_9ACTN|nr:LCP family protein [Baekduia soli]QEC47478.1 LytR family transcriptional regulator [Baekduia soli]
MHVDASRPPPEYTKYRTAPRLLRRGPRDGGSLLDELRRGRGADAPPLGGAPAPQPGPAGPGAPPPEAPGRRRLPLPWRPRRRGPISVGRVVKWIVLAVLGWLALSLVLFLISAQLQQGDLSGKVSLAGAGYPLTSANTILVLGSDQRTKGSKEPGASTSGPSRSDSIMLMRVGGGRSARLSIPRDTVVDIPGHGRNKINAAYAFGGPALAVQTIEQYLGIKVNHLIEVDFANFPQLIDAMGGIDYEGGCVVSRINGGFKNGGYTLRLKKGKTHIDGKQALALARTRHNDCNARESDLTRARRQQKILSAMKSRLVSPYAFPRLPFIAWNTPKALKSDMGGPTLLGLFGALATGGSPPTRILKPDGFEQAPGGGAGLHVSDAEKQRDVARFLKG